MGDDPILQIGISVMVVLMPLLSLVISRKKPRNIFIVPVVSMFIALPLFLFVVILQGSTSWSKYLFYASMILWTGALFTMLINLIIYRKVKNKSYNKQID